jgi:PKD repeat protein
MAIDSLHFSVAAVRELLRASHEQGAGCWSVDAGGRVFQFSVGAPRKVFVDETPRRGSGRHGTEALPLVAEVPVAYNHRDPDRLGDAGLNGVALVRVAMLFEVPRHSGRVPQHLKNHYRVDCSATQPSDVEVHPTQVDDTDSIAETIAVLVREHYGGTHPLPDYEYLPFSPTPPVRVVTRAGRSPQVILVTAGATRGDDAQAKGSEDVPAVAFDPGEGARWIARVSSESLAPELAKLEHSVRGLASKSGEEITTPQARVEDGELVIGGSGKSGEREMRVSLERPTNVNAGLIQTRVVGESDRLSADVAAVAGELLVAATGIPGQYLLPSRPLLVGRNYPLEATVRLIRASLSREGLLLHGAIQQGGEERDSVIADFTALRSPESLLGQTCDASRSWAAGSEIVRLDWDFGDGTTESSADDALELVVTHEYAVEGEYEVTLTVTDARECRASRTRTLSVGALDLDVSVPLCGDVGVVTALRLLSGRAPVEGAQLTVRSEDLHQELITDGDGAAMYEGPWAIFKPQPGSAPVISVGRDGWIHASGAAGEREWPVTIVRYETLKTSMRCVALCDTLLAADDLSERTDMAYMPGLLRAIKATLLGGALPRWPLGVDDRVLEEPSEALVAVERWLQATVDSAPSIGPAASASESR